MGGAKGGEVVRQPAFFRPSDKKGLKKLDKLLPEPVSTEDEASKRRPSALSSSMDLNCAESNRLRSSMACSWEERYLFTGSSRIRTLENAKSRHFFCLSNLSLSALSACRALVSLRRPASSPSLAARAPSAAVAFSLSSREERVAERDQKDLVVATTGKSMNKKTAISLRLLVQDVRQRQRRGQADGQLEAVAAKRPEPVQSRCCHKLWTFKKIVKPVRGRGVPFGGGGGRGGPAVALAGFEEDEALGRRHLFASSAPKSNFTVLFCAALMHPPPHQLADRHPRLSHMSS